MLYLPVLSSIAIRFNSTVYIGNTTYYDLIKLIGYSINKPVVRGCEFGFIASPSNTFVTQQQAALIVYSSGLIHKPINILTQSHFNSLRLQYPDKFK